MRREFSAGGIVYRNLQNSKTQKFQTLWLIRRPAGNSGYRGNLGWSFPKGLIDEGEKLDQAAIREVREEGGVEARIVAKLPTLKIFFTDQGGEKIMKFITYFVMEYQSDAPKGHDWETEETRWVMAKRAQDLLVYKNERELLREAIGMIQSADA